MPLRLIPSRPDQRGFTLIELMVTMGIVAVLAAYAVPSARDMIQAAKMRSASSDLYSALIIARTEAIKRRANVTVAPVSSDWKNGWTITSGGSTLGAHDALESGVLVRVNVADDPATDIVYSMNGRVSTSSQQNIIFHLNPITSQPRCVNIDPSGLPRSRTDTNMTASDGCN